MPPCRIGITVLNHGIERSCLLMSPEDGSVNISGWHWRSRRGAWKSVEYIAAVLVHIFEPLVSNGQA